MEIEEMTCACIFVYVILPRYCMKICKRSVKSRKKRASRIKKSALITIPTTTAYTAVKTSTVLDK